MKEFKYRITDGLSVGVGKEGLFLGLWFEQPVYSAGQSIRVSASASVLPMNIQD